MLRRTTSLLYQNKEYVTYTQILNDGLNTNKH